MRVSQQTESSLFCPFGLSTKQYRNLTSKKEYSDQIAQANMSLYCTHVSYGLFHAMPLCTDAHQIILLSGQPVQLRDKIKTRKLCL